MKVFSFCIFGNKKKYLLGLCKNIEIINEKFPDFYIWIYAGNDIPEEYIIKYKSYKNIKYIETEYNNRFLTCMRFFPIDESNIDLFFSRDTDSRITNRDIWCINQFIKSDKTYHVVREHYFHKALIMTGIFGAKKNINININLSEKFNEIKNELCENYNIDVDFVNKFLYNSIKNDLLIHTNIVAFKNEYTEKIDLELENNYDFVGNVYDFDENNIEYCVYKYFDENIMNHLQWLDEQRQLEIISRIGIEFEKYIYLYSPYNRNCILDKIYVANYYLKKYDECIRILSLFKYTHITEHNIFNSNYLLNDIQKKIIGTCDPNREPNEDEIIICYGNYCHDIYNLPISNKIYRNVLYYNMINHNIFEFDKSWNKIEKIYIINLIERKDRYIEVLSELAKLNFPFNRIYHVKGEKNNLTNDKLLNSYLGATDSHLQALKDMKKNNLKNCLILEDDFIFNFNYNEIKKNINLFFERNYDYDVCLISASKFHQITPYDDLLSLSHQECTTTSGYIVSKDGIDKVLDCFQDGYNKMLETKDYNKYVCDRYWNKLQKNNKFFVFNKKFGYQRVTYSDIKNNINYNFD